MGGCQNLGGAWPLQAPLDPPLMPELFITYWKIRIIIQRSQRTERSESHQDESSPSSFDHSVNIDHDSQAEAIIENSHGTTDDRLESSPTDLTNESSHFDTPLPSHIMIPHSSFTSLDIAGSNEVSDISNSMCDDPVQPRQHRFPATLFGNKTRSFNPQWFDKHTWLQYSIKKDQLFAMSVVSSQQVHMVKSCLLELGIRTGSMHVVKVEKQHIFMACACHGGMEGLHHCQEQQHFNSFKVE